MSAEVVSKHSAQERRRYVQQEKKKMLTKGNKFKMHATNSLQLNDQDFQGSCSKPGRPLAVRSIVVCLAGFVFFAIGMLKARPGFVGPTSRES